MAARACSMSSYGETLNEEAKAQYRDKIKLIDGLDPFGGCPGDPSELVPPVDASDLVSYLVLQTNFITAQQFKARKSLEAYNQFVCGWVKDIRSWKVAGKYMPTGCVSLSCVKSSSLLPQLNIIELATSTDDSVVHALVLVD